MFLINFIAIYKLLSKYKFSKYFLSFVIRIYRFVNHFPRFAKGKERKRDGIINYIMLLVYKVGKHLLNN